MQDQSLYRSSPVRRRYVVYVPGYDPEARTRYRSLFVRELLRHARLRGESRRRISPAAVTADGLVQHWSVAAHAETDGAEIAYDVLLWDDLVVRDLDRSRSRGIATLLATMLHAIGNGSILRFYRRNWKCASVVIFPFTAAILTGLLGCVLAVLVHILLGSGMVPGVKLPLAATLPLAGAAGIGGILLCGPILKHLHFWHLLNDWIFIWQHAHGRRADYDARLTVFAGIVHARLRALQETGAPLDEVMVVGHSSGALTAVELVDRLLHEPPGGEAVPPRLSLATLGSSMPLVLLQPGAAEIRRVVARVARDPRLTWVDYFAPQDWLNCSNDGSAAPAPFDGKLPPEGDRVLRSARFREILDPATYARVRSKPFRMHFQFLMSNDRPGAYDYFSMVLGPWRLRDWVALESTRMRPRGSGAALPASRPASGARSVEI